MDDIKTQVVRFECDKDDFAVESEDEDEIFTAARIHVANKHGAEINTEQFSN